MFVSLMRFDIEINSKSYKIIKNMGDLKIVKYVHYCRIIGRAKCILFKELYIVGVIFSIGLMLSCDSNDDDQVAGIKVEIDIEDAKLSSFPLLGVIPNSIEIIDPEIFNNRETKPGEIKIKVPNGTPLDKISALISSKELDLSKFEFSPSNGVQLSYVDQKENVYTIRAVENEEIVLHYRVSIIEEKEEKQETLKITNFTFEKSKNPELPNDIAIARTIEGSGLDKIYVFVPIGTDFTNLIPTITYDGTKLYYTQNSSIVNEEYPVEGKSIDFKYPKNFILTVRDKDDNKQKTTVIIVDVINPIRVEEVSVITPDAKEGESVFFTKVTQWVNQGNHKIEYQDTKYENKEPIGLPTNVITAHRDLPSGGLEPGESRDVDIKISGDYPEGTYKTTAVFYSKIQNHEEVSDLLEPAKLEITSKIVF